MPWHGRKRTIFRIIVEGSIGQTVKCTFTRIRDRERLIRDAILRNVDTTQHPNDARVFSPRGTADLPKLVNCDRLIETETALEKWRADDVDVFVFLSDYA